jgi:hypothetical protein
LYDPARRRYAHDAVHDTVQVGRASEAMVTSVAMLLQAGVVGVQLFHAPSHCIT